MKNFKWILTPAGRFLPVALVVAAGAAFASPALANHHHSVKPVQLHASSTAVHGGNAARGDHPVPPKPKPLPHHHGRRHKKHPPHPGGN